MLVILGILIAYVLHTYARGLTELCVKKIMGYRLHCIRFLFWDISYVNDSYRCTKRSFMPLFYIAMTKENVSDKTDIIHSIITKLVETLVDVMIFCLFFNWSKIYFDIWEDDIYSFVMGLAIGIVLFCIVDWVLLLKLLINKDNHLFYVVKKIGRDLKNGYPIEYIDMPQLESMPHKRTPLDENYYQSMRFMQKLYMGNYGELMPIVNWYENHLIMDVQKYQIPSYGNVVFYYSYISQNPDKARVYYDRAREELENDVDANGRRILAYYQLYILKNPAKAREFAQAGLNVLNVGCLSQIERNLEEKLLNNLLEIISYMDQSSYNANYSNI